MGVKSRFDPLRVARTIGDLMITGFSGDDARRIAIKIESERALQFRQKLIQQKMSSTVRNVQSAPVRPDVRSDAVSSAQKRSKEAESHLEQPQSNRERTAAPTTTTEAESRLDQPQSTRARSTTSTTTASTRPVSGESSRSTVPNVSDPMVVTSKGDSDDEGERRRRSRSQDSSKNIVKLRSKSYVSDTAKRRPVKPKIRVIDCNTPSCSQSTEERVLSRITK